MLRINLPGLEALLSVVYFYLRSSQDNSNAVSIGSFDERAIRDGEARARYALMRERECLKESSILEVTHSSQPHLQNRKYK